MHFADRGQWVDDMFEYVLANDRVYRFTLEGAGCDIAVQIGAHSRVRPRPVPKLGPFEIDHKSAA